MYFIILEASPDETHPEREAIGGAFAACWVATDDAMVAEREARAVLADAGWTVGAVDEHYPVDRERYLGSPDSLARYDRALADGICVNLNTWPPRRRRGGAAQRST